MVECHSGRIGHPLRALEPKPGGVGMGAMGHPYIFQMFWSTCSAYGHGLK